jgi:hypothetical protein
VCLFNLPHIVRRCSRNGLCQRTQTCAEQRQPLIDVVVKLSSDVGALFLLRFYQSLADGRQRRFGGGALDQVGGLAGQHVEQAEIVLGRGMRPAPVRGNHAERPARSRSQRSRLHGTDSGTPVRVEVLRTGHEAAVLHVGDEDTLARAQRVPAGAARVGRDPPPEHRRFRMKMSAAEKRQRFAVFGEHLDAARVSRHQFYGCLQDLREQRFLCRFRNQACADRLQRSNSGNFGCQAPLACAQSGLCSFALRDVTRDL